MIYFVVSCVIGCAVAGMGSADAAGSSEIAEPVPARQRARGQPREVTGVYKSQIVPHWFHDGTRFWYRNDLRSGVTEFILVDAELGIRQPAFDHQRLAAALSKAAAQDFAGQRLPFDSIEFIEDDRAIRFVIAGENWRCNLESYECTRVDEPSRTPQQRLTEQSNPEQRRARPARLDEPGRPLPSPDGSRTALIKDHNVFVRSGDAEFQLSSDGDPNHYYGRLEWSPDSTTLIGWRIEPGERKEVHLIESSPPTGGRAIVHTRLYDLPGDKFTAFELNVFDVGGRTQTKVAVERVDFGTPRLRWNRDGTRLTYQKVDRGHQRFRVIELNPRNGSVRNIIDETTSTFMDTNVPPESTMRFVDALIKAGKDFDLLVIPGAGHGMGGAYGQRRMQDFFLRHLLGAEPRNHNSDKGLTAKEHRGVTGQEP